MKVILVDDEYYALQGLRMELEELGGIEVAGMYEEGQKVLEEMSEINPDIIFLDIEMPGMNGLELFQKILEVDKNPNIVFVTAYNHYAVKAFELNAMDYIVKPVQKSRLIKTLERIKPGIGHEKGKKSISVQCFRHLSVMVEGQELNSRWRTQKAEELLAYLICEKGQFVSKEKIAEALWPELDGEKSVSNLYLAYYYLKKHFELSNINLPIESERGRMRIRLENMDCDINKFDRYIEVCLNINDENISVAEKAEEIFKGALLEDSYYAWSFELQQKYEVVYLELLKKIAVYYREKRNNEKYKYYMEKFR